MIGNPLLAKQSGIQKRAESNLLKTTEDSWFSHSMPTFPILQSISIFPIRVNVVNVAKEEKHVNGSTPIIILKTPS